MRIIPLLVCIHLSLLPWVCSAELVNKAQITDTGVTLYTLPKVAAPPGWHVDAPSSDYFQANALAPDGTTFHDASTVMYAKAIYKPSRPELKSLKDLVVQDLHSFETEDPSITVRETNALVTADGHHLRSLTFSPGDNGGNWEQVSYGEDGDYYLIFAISSRTREGYQNNVAAYGKLVASYRHQ